MKKALLVIGLLAAGLAHAEPDYNFSAGGPGDGSFEHNKGGVIRDATFKDATFTNSQDDVLMGYLYHPLHGQADIASSFVERGPSFGGRSAGVCDGRGLCKESKQPIVLRPEHTEKATELDKNGAIAAFVLLAGGVLILKSRRRIR
jgi:hypothetical protein